MSNYSITLWDSLKYEVLNVQEEDLAEEALASLQAIATRLSHGLTSMDSKSYLAQYFRPITKEINDQLQEPQHKQAKPAGQILSHLGTASPLAYLLVVKAVMPPLLTLYQAAENIAKQRALLEVLVQLFNAAILVQGPPIALAFESTGGNPLDPFHDRLVEIFSQALMSTVKDEMSFRIVALRGLLRLCSIRKYFSDSEVGLAVQYFDEIVLDEEYDRDDLQREAIQALVGVSRIRPHLVMDITFPAFMARLPDLSPPGNTDYLITLEGLAQLSVEKAISDTLIRRLLSQLDVVLQAGGSPSYPQAILSTLLYILRRRDLPSDTNLTAYYEKMVLGLIKRAVLGSVGHSSTTALNEPETLEILGRLANLIVGALDERTQKSVSLQVYTLFTDEALFSPVLSRENVPYLQRLTMILSTYLIAATKREVTFFHHRTQHLLTVSVIHSIPR